jgi:MoxR-like ATPase
MYDFLINEGVPKDLCRAAENWAAAHPAAEGQKNRIPQPYYRYYGEKIWEAALTALLCGKNLLLVGGKASGKNVLAENLALALGRPAWNISFHINMDAAGLIGTDTLESGEVVFRPGPVYQCAEYGGFGIMDEVNMAKNEAMAVLHSVLDHRRVIDVPGYHRIELKEETRFIATMNYGYAGTRELNEALTSRFAVIRMPVISEDNLNRLIDDEFPQMGKRYRTLFVSLFFDIYKKSSNGEISTRTMDLRGLIDALHMISHGLDVRTALDMGIANKTFDDYERNLVQDIIKSRIPSALTGGAVFDSL